MKPKTERKTLVQSIHFPQNKWDRVAAFAWLGENGYETKAEETPTELRYRQYEPKRGVKYSTKVIEVTKHGNKLPINLIVEYVNEPLKKKAVPEKKASVKKEPVKKAKRGRGRPEMPSGKARTVNVSFKVSEDEKKDLTKKVAGDMSAYLRKKIGLKD